MSSSFNPLERTIARFLSRLPMLKRLAKRCYALVMYVLKRKPYKSRLATTVKSIQDAGENTFFGYYDKSPVNAENSYMIYQQVDTDTSVKPSQVKQVEVCLSSFPENKTVMRLPSCAFNWQQGTKLQWLTNTKFIYNDYDAENEKYVARIVDIEHAKVIQTLDKPIYDCFEDVFALSLSFERLAVYSADYGYFAKQSYESDLLPDDQDGICFIDLKTGQHELYLSLNNIAGFEPLPTMHSAKHTVNHIMISPSGTRFMFIHRWFQQGRRYDRLLVVDIESRVMRSVASNDMVSHCFWQDDHSIFSYLRGPNGKDSYWKIAIDKPVFSEFKALEGFGDGHPHILGDVFVTDTYPDKARMQHLFHVNLDTQEVCHLAEFYHGFKFDGETRCDLHPRMSQCGKYCFVDTVYSGKRRFTWLEFLA